MSAVTVTAGGHDWLWSEIGQAPLAGRLRAVATATIIDDLTLAPPRARLDVTSRTIGFAARANEDGLAGLYGVPARLIPKAKLAGAPVAFDVAAPGFEPLALSGALTAVAAYPEVFTPTDFGLRRLVRRAVEIRGRVFRVVAGVAQPAAGATVAISAATSVPPLPGAIPAPPPAASFTAISVTADGDGAYALPPVARAALLQITASEGGGSLSRVIAPDYADPVMLLDFRLA